MNLKNLKNKKIAILGLGIENYALVNFILKKKINCKITICDKRSKKELKDKYKELKNKAAWKLGEDFNKNLEEFDILFRSPGWPIHGVKKSIKSKVKSHILTSPMKLFFDLCPTKNIIGVTGTKGKGTTSSLVYEILKMAGKKVWLGGNIGIAPFAFFDKIKKNDWVVLELSSFQLEDMEISPHIAIITNFYSEHLAPADPNNPNYHKTLGVYFDAKLNIARWQGENDFYIVNEKIKNKKSKLQSKIKKFKGKMIYFNKSELQSKLLGGHNKENIAAAAEVAKIVGIKDNIIKKAVANFKGLEHRLEFVRATKSLPPPPPPSKGGNRDTPLRKGGWGVIKFYNDTFATTPESSVTALKSFSSPMILIAGGAEKNSDFKEFVREVKKRAKYIILLNGDATPRIKKELLKINYPLEKIKIVNSMKEAVKIAYGVAEAGDIILLSPACASFGMFTNYKKRGFLFKQEVKKIK